MDLVLCEGPQIFEQGATISQSILQKCVYFDGSWGRPERFIQATSNNSFCTFSGIPTISLVGPIKIRLVQYQPFLQSQGPSKSAYEFISVIKKCSVKTLGNLFSALKKTALVPTVHQNPAIIFVPRPRFTVTNDGIFFCHPTVVMGFWDSHPTLLGPGLLS